MENKFFEIHHYDTVEEILSFAKTTWLHRKFGDFIFRGQSNIDDTLLPSAWRPKNNISYQKLKNEIIKIFDRKREGIDKILRLKINEITQDSNSISRIYSYVWQVVIEIYIVHEFTHRANLIALNVDRINPFGKLKKHEDMVNLLSSILFGGGLIGLTRGYLSENSFLAKLKSINSIDFDIKFSSDYFTEHYFPAFALAQHHGIATRFLDWTKDPLKALYFALGNISDKQTSGKAGIIALDRDVLGDYGINISEDFPHYAFQFLHMQNGIFTYSPFGDGYYLKYGIWPSIEDLLSLMGEEHFKMLKITFDISLKNELLDQLEKEGISKESLMPTYNHVADSINSRFQN